MDSTQNLCSNCGKCFSSIAKLKKRTKQVHDLSPQDHKMDVSMIGTKSFAPNIKTIIQNKKKLLCVLNLIYRLFTLRSPLCLLYISRNEYSARLEMKNFLFFLKICQTLFFFVNISD